VIAESIVELKSCGRAPIPLTPTRNQDNRKLRFASTPFSTDAANNEGLDAPDAVHAAAGIRTKPPPLH